MFGRYTWVITFTVFVMAIYMAWDQHEHTKFLLNRLSSLMGEPVDSLNTKKSNKQRLFTEKELSTFNGVDRPEIYLSILGTVYDVIKGAKHYGPGQSYNIFVGKDSSRSFVTGKFCVEEASDKVDDFKNEELKSLFQWSEFYKKEYEEVGKLIGTYYDEYGEPTPYSYKIQKLFELAQKASEAENIEKRKYPPCNVEWAPDTGSRVWCTTGSGGIDRTWEGFPRKLYEAGSKDYRCACIKEEDLNNPILKEYLDCPKDSKSCYVKDTADDGNTVTAISKKDYMDKTFEFINSSNIVLLNRERSHRTSSEGK